MDIIDQAFTSGGTFMNWDQLSRWLKSNAPRVNHVSHLIEASRRAQEDGVALPANADETRWIIKKYERLSGHSQ